MSGGNTKPDPYFSRDPQNQTKQRNPQSSMKSYKDAVRPKRITCLPTGKRRYYYDCKNCGKEFGSRVRKHNKHAFCGRDCFDKWQKYGIKHPKPDAEQRKQMAKRTRDSWKNPEIRKRRMKGLKKAFQDPEFRKRIKKRAKEVARRPKWRKKQSKAHKGKKRPPDVGKKISKAKMGHPVSDDTRKKLADAFKGKKSRWYKHGRSSERQRYYRSWRWRRKTKQIKRRDNNTCQGCGWTEDEAGPLAVHHLAPLQNTKYDESNYPDDLLATLCKPCHAKTEEQEGDLKWPLNSRGDDEKLDRLKNPKQAQTYLPDFSE